MAEAEYRRFTVARDCQKKNTSENHSECMLGDNDVKRHPVMPPRRKAALQHQASALPRLWLEWRLRLAAVVAVAAAVFITPSLPVHDDRSAAAGLALLPAALAPILGEWARDATRVQAVRAALQAGQAVVIHEAFNQTLAMAMRDELLALQWSKDERSTAAADMPDPGIFRNFPISPRFREKSACLSVMKHAGDAKFFFSHQQLAPDTRPEHMVSTLEFTRALKGTELRDWAGSALLNSRLGDAGTALRLMVRFSHLVLGRSDVRVV
jgi:hypothetical protein